MLWCIVTRESDHPHIRQTNYDFKPFMRSFSWEVPHKFGLTRPLSRFTDPEAEAEDLKKNYEYRAKNLSLMLLDRCRRMPVQSEILRAGYKVSEVVPFLFVCTIINIVFKNHGLSWVQSDQKTFSELRSRLSQVKQIL
jgi:hypothetical protein